MCQSGFLAAILITCLVLLEKYVIERLGEKDLFGSWYKGVQSIMVGRQGGWAHSSLGLPDLVV